MINCFEACVLVDGMENHSLVAAFCFVGDGAAGGGWQVVSGEW